MHQVWFEASLGFNIFFNYPCIVFRFWVYTGAEDCSGYMFSKCELDLDGLLATLESGSPGIASGLPKRGVKSLPRFLEALWH